MNISALKAIRCKLEKILEKHLHMLDLTFKLLIGHLSQSFVPMLHAKEKCCINNSREVFRITGKEKDWHLTRIMERIFINHFELFIK